MFPIRDHNPSTRTPYVTVGLIIVNLAVFFSTLSLATDPAGLRNFYDTWALVPARLSAGSGWETLISSMFLHGGFMHIAGNMLFLWIFGDNLEDELGHVGFLVFYLASGIGAGLAQYLSAPFSPVPTVGASGAIAGVMGGYLLLFPRARVDVLLIFIIFFRVFPMPAWAMLGVWFVLQLFSGATIDSSAGGVAYWAHAGGFVVGFLWVLPVFLRRGGARFWRETEGRPPHAEAKYRLSPSSIPRSGRRR